MDWDKLKTFHAAANAGSLTGAAEWLGVSQSAVSRQISALEEQLGVALFHRHPRGLKATEQGRILHTAARDIAARLALAESALADSREQPSGLVHLVAPIALGTRWLTPRLKHFMELYPDIHLQLDLSDEEPDLSSFEVQAALVLGRPDRPDLVARRVMTVRQHLYASKAYLAAHGEPQTATDLDDHTLVAYHTSPEGPLLKFDWALSADSNGKQRKAAFSASTVLGVLSAIRADVGIGSLPDYVARRHEELVRVLPDAEGPKFEVYLVYPEELRGSKRITAFRDFLVAEAQTFER